MTVSPTKETRKRRKLKVFIFSCFWFYKMLSHFYRNYFSCLNTEKWPSSIDAYHDNKSQMKIDASLGSKIHGEGEGSFLNMTDHGLSYK